MRTFLLLPWVLATAWARPAALTVQVDLNKADLNKPLRPQHEVAFQLEARPPGKEGAPGGVVKVFRLPDQQLVATLRRDPEKPDAPETVKASGYLYRQLFIWPGWRKAGPGQYLAQYQGNPKLEVRFQLP